MTSGGKAAKADPMVATAESPEVAHHNEVQDWFDRWADQLGMRLPEFLGNRLPEFWGAGRELAGVIRIEEHADEDGLTIRGELPGIDPDRDVEITVEDGRLHINAERRETSERSDDGRFRTEFRYGSYRRSFPLPPGAVVDDIGATYADGILTVKIPVTGDRTDVTRVPVRKSE